MCGAKASLSAAGMKDSSHSSPSLAALLAWPRREARARSSISSMRTAPRARRQGGERVLLVVCSVK